MLPNSIPGKSETKNRLLQKPELSKTDDAMSFSENTASVRPEGKIVSQEQLYYKP